MAKGPESLVKAAVVKILKQHGAYYFFPATHGMGRSGVPDIVACINGRFLGIECKAGKNQPTGLQMKELIAITAAGGNACVVTENDMNYIEGVIKLIKGV